MPERDTFLWPGDTEASFTPPAVPEGHRLRRALDEQISTERFVQRLHAAGDDGSILDARLMWETMSSELHLPSPSPSNPTSESASFATLAYALGRLDVLRAVIDAGKPAWLEDDDIDSPGAWMRVLSTVYSPFGKFHTSLYHFAAMNPLPWAKEAMAMMLEYDPEHIDIDLLADSYPDARALWTEVCMAKRIAEHAGSSPREPQKARRRSKAT